MLFFLLVCSFLPWKSSNWSISICHLTIYARIDFEEVAERKKEKNCLHLWFARKVHANCVHNIFIYSNVLPLNYLHCNQKSQNKQSEKTKWVVNFDLSARVVECNFPIKLTVCCFYFIFLFFSLLHLVQRQWTTNFSIINILSFGWRCFLVFFFSWKLIFFFGRFRIISVLWNNFLWFFFYYFIFFFRKLCLFFFACSLFNVLVFFCCCNHLN